MVEDFVAEVTYLEYLQKEKSMNDNHVLHNNDSQEEKGKQLHSAYRRLSSENISRAPLLTLIVPSANSVSLLKISVANRLIHAIHKNCIVYLFL